jgi:hypothetical protein
MKVRLKKDAMGLTPRRLDAYAVEMETLPDRGVEEVRPNSPEVQPPVMSMKRE